MSDNEKQINFITKKNIFIFFFIITPIYRCTTVPSQYNEIFSIIDVDVKITYIHHHIDRILYPNSTVTLKDEKRSSLNLL